MSIFEYNLHFPTDFIIIVLVSLITIFSFWKGLIQSILSLLTWVGSILITIYAYQSFADFLTKQLLNISFFQNYEYFTGIISKIIGIPLIFLISLFILKRIRKFLSADLDKQILGIIIDKIFGFLYGLLFSYIIISALIILLNRYEFNGLDTWLDKNSIIILEIKDFNKSYIPLINNEEIIN